MASNYWALFACVVAFAYLSKISSSSDSTFTCSHNLPSCGTNTNNVTLCCPYKNGVCCNNTKACCPENSVCFPNVGQCMPRNKMGLMKTTKVYSAAPLYLQDSKTRIKLEVCPSKKSICPTKSTCCPAPYIGYDCCPLVNGICCGDFKHCCPFNSTCELSTGQCLDAYQNKFPWTKKITAEKIDLTHVKKIKLIKNLVRVCQDQETRCEHNHTCCPSSNGKYECCAFSNAVCCTGGTHCCPPGTSCGNSTSDCLHVTHSEISFNKKKNVFSYEINMPLAPSTHYQLRLLLNASVQMVCPGGRYSCPDYMTCCPSSGGAYGCCPYPNAVCCTDKQHCCPASSQCDLVHNRCTRGVMFTPLFETIKIKASLPKPPIKQFCPDKATCPDSTTCCQLPSLAYGCCPFPSAVCCSDKIHCCPQGTTCDLEKGTCRNGNHVNILSLQRVNATTDFKLLP